jgi:hypothetical protein
MPILSLVSYKYKILSIDLYGNVIKCVTRLLWPCKRLADKKNLMVHGVYHK